MPETVVHHFFGKKVLEDLPQEIRSRIIPGIYRTGIRGPDPLGIVRFWCPPVWKKKHGRSNVMHTQLSGPFFQRLTKEAGEQTGEIRDQLFSFECGFLTHYFLDSICHPYVIYRTGLGKGFSGNHRSLEHAMDRILLEENGLDRAGRPIFRQILQKKGLPASMKKPVDDVYKDVFGWPEAWREINHSLRDERRFLRLTEDPKGRLYRLIRRVTRNGTLLSLSYAEKAYENADIRNETHQLWRNPYDPSMTSGRSFPELQEEALQRAAEAIRGLYDCVYGNAACPECIGGRSYESGLDTEDPRNRNIPVSECLQR